jgi:hypothetical protein
MHSRRSLRKTRTSEPFVTLRLPRAAGPAVRLRPAASSEPEAAPLPNRVTSSPGRATWMPIRAHPNLPSSSLDGGTRRKVVWEGVSPDSSGHASVCRPRRVKISRTAAITLLDPVDPDHSKGPLPLDLRIFPRLAPAQQPVMAPCAPDGTAHVRGGFPLHALGADRVNV